MKSVTYGPLSSSPMCLSTARGDRATMPSSWTMMLNQTAAWTTPRVGALVNLDLGADLF